LDGYIARKFNQKTVFGTILDPMADKLLMSILTVSLAYTGFFFENRKQNLLFLVFYFIYFIFAFLFLF